MSMKPVVSTALSLVLVGVVSTFGSIALASAYDIDQGKQVAFDRKTGNDLACHLVAGESLPGNMGPPLIAMQARFPSTIDLRAQIWDPTARGQNTIVPPYGKHRILSEREVDLVTEFIYTLQSGKQTFRGTEA